VIGWTDVSVNMLWVAGPIVGKSTALSRITTCTPQWTNYLGAQGYWHIASTWSPIAGRAWRSRLGIRQPRRSRSEVGVNPYFSRGELIDIEVPAAEQVRATGEVLHVAVVNLLRLDRDGVVSMGLQRGCPLGPSVFA